MHGDTCSNTLRARAFGLAIVLACVGLACGDNFEPATPPGDEPDAAVDAGPPPACEGAVLETVREAAYGGPVGRFTYGTALAISPAGEIHAAFSERADDSMAIFVADRDEQGWTEPVQIGITDFPLPSPRILERDGTLHLVWSHGPAGKLDIPNRDVYYSSRPTAGGTWAEPANITGLYESERQRDGFGPSLAISPEDEMVVAYEAGYRDPLLGPILLGSSGRVIQIEDGAAAAPPVDVMPATFGGCYRNYPRFAADGALHLASICAHDGDWLFYHAFRVAGRWSEARPVVPRPNGLAAATGPDGVVRVAWAECEDTGACAVFYAALSDGPLVLLATLPTPPRSYVHEIAMRQDGRVLILLSSIHESGPRQMHVLDSADGATFGLCDLTPSADGDEQAGEVAFDPNTGEASILFNRETSTAILLEHVRLP